MGPRDDQPGRDRPRRGLIISYGESARYNRAMAREGALDLKLAGETLTLLPQRAIYWSARKTLILADPHIGKDDTFHTAV